MQRIDELQDLVIQQRQVTDVSLIVDAQAQLRSLNTELAKKGKLIEDLKMKMQHFNTKRNAKDLKNDEDMAEYLVNIIKDKEKVIEEMQFRQQQLVKKEMDLKEKVDRYEFLYEPEKTGGKDQTLLRKDDVLREINRKIEQKQGGAVQYNKQPADTFMSMREKKDKSEWLYF